MDAGACAAVSGNPADGCCPSLTARGGSTCREASCEPLGVACDLQTPCCEGLACVAGTCEANGMCPPAGAPCHLMDPNGCCGDAFCTIDWLDGTLCYRRATRLAPEVCEPTEF